MKNKYCGRILNSPYTVDLKNRLTDCIDRFHAFDECGGPAIPYIAAWHENEGVVWYEFAGKRFVELMGCDCSDLHETFRKGIIDRREYKVLNKGIRQKTIDKLELKNLRTNLRDEIEKKGIEEAVYKVVSKKKEMFWIKDQAIIESFEPDKINISLGCLTIVTKEMETEEQLKKTQGALRKSEEKFRKQAIHDNLTGLYNTRYLYKALSKLISESTDTRVPFSLIFMDIDDFKNVVDTFGHLNASQALQEFAATIRSTLHEPSYGVAYGGDEFVVVLPGYTKHKAIEMAESIRSKISETIYLSKVGVNVNLCASFGVASYPDDATGLRELLSLADEAMFSVKEHGKNSVRGIT
ncbi:MAG: GGDEF domain-containing protein [Deltaproteobacteria bacterium]|nr:GGDEF domain-containing protein [Deltaproteobacteria bacterium]MBW2218072.1 GGDEF domain-containing protein [Deltaproteobacteria bacterium]